MSKTKRRTKKKAHPEAPKPFAGIREVIFNAFAKIGSPIDNTDVLHIERKSAGVRVEVVKTISFLTHKQMMKLLGLIRFKSVRLSRFRISAATHKGKACLRFLFFVQGARSSVTANVDVLETDIEQAAEFLAKRAERPQHMNTHATVTARLTSFFELISELQARDHVEIVAAMSPACKEATEKMRASLKREGISAKIWGGRGDRNSFQVVPDTPRGSFGDHAVFFIAQKAKELGCTYVQGMPIVVREAVGGAGFTFYVGMKPRPHRPSSINPEENKKFHEERWARYKKSGGTVEAAGLSSFDEKALAAQYHETDFVFRLANRNNDTVTRRVRAYTRDHAVAKLKAAKQWPRGYGIASASGKAQRR